MHHINNKEICVLILGKYIRNKRKELKLTQEELAEHARLTPYYMGRIERGEKEVGSYILWKILNILKADWNTLSKEIEEAVIRIAELENKKSKHQTILEKV